ncbi:MAG: septum formation initiator family protein [Flavobacteriaceae bacterium]|nr:septum formation initiator family protein [Flavobacteriaceae bacterium]
MAKSSKTYHRYLKPFKNIFLVTLIVFTIWMLFFDTHSWFLHNELNKEIEKLKNEKRYYSNEIKKDKKDIKKLSSNKGIETYGREHYKMKKENEDIYLVEYEDSLKTQTNE